MTINTVLNRIITSTPTANAIAQFDGNLNLSGNNLIGGFATTTRTGIGTTYPLTVASAENQQYTASAAGDAVLLPLTTTLVAGMSYTIINNSSGALTVKDSTNTNTFYSVPVAYAVTFICVLNSGATVASWYIAQPFRPVIEGTYTPTFTFSTVGDLSVSYSVQTGFYRQFPTPTGSLVWIYGTMQCTPTYTTASGQPSIVVGTAPGNISPSNSMLIMPVAQGINFGSGNTYAFLQGAGSSNIFSFCAQGTTKAAGSAFNMTAASNFTSATALQLYWEGWYRSA